jgi:hypothetical protein
MEEPDIQGIEPDITYGQQDSLTMIETKFYRRSSPLPFSIFKRALEHTHMTEGVGLELSELC